MLRDCKRRHTNLAIAWIDYKKTYDMVSHSCISESLEIFGIANKVQDFLNKSVKSWKLELNISGEKSGKGDIRRRVFNCNSLSSLLFVLCMVALTYFVELCSTCSLRRNFLSIRNGHLINNILFQTKLIWSETPNIQIPNLDWPQKITLIAFWKYYFTWHNLNIIWVIFNFLGYFVNMYPSIHEHFLLISNSWTNFPLLLAEIYVLLLLKLTSLSAFVIRGLLSWYKI